jgi:hypothetical protein
VTTEPFYIAFSGTANRFAVLSRVFERLRLAKDEFEAASDPQAAADTIVADPAWSGLLDDDAVEELSDSDGWQLEDILWAILNGEYRLAGLEFDGSAGRLEYDPAAFPFGGTDPLKALVEICGLEVTRDSFWDGFAEWQRRRAGPSGPGA